MLITAPTLVAGAHRLAAYKLLGRDEIPCTAFMSVDDHDQLKLAEIDENLVRNELSAAEKAKHVQLKVELLAKSKIDGKKVEREEAYRKKNKLKDNQIPPKTDNAYPLSAESDQEVANPLSEKAEATVTKAAEAAARAEAIQEAAEAMGTDPTHVRAEIRKAEALDKLDMDIEDTSKLTGQQLGRVTKVVNDKKVEVARGVVEKKAEKEKAYRERNNVTTPQISDKACQIIAVQAEAAAIAEATQEVANDMGTDPTHVRAAFKAVKECGPNIKNLTKLIVGLVGEPVKT